MIEGNIGLKALTIDADAVLAELGNGKAQYQPDEAMRREINDLLREIDSLPLCGRFALKTTAMNSLAAFQPGPVIMGQLKGSEALCFFVATAGIEYERWQQRLMHEGDMVRVYIANEIGSMIAERIADHVEFALEQQITPKGLGHTNRFSPGYCGWDVADQRQLFDIFTRESGDSPCGITLTESCLMIPIKSVSGVIGIGRGIQKHDYKCGRCGLQSCYKAKFHI